MTTGSEIRNFDSKILQQARTLFNIHSKIEREARRSNLSYVYMYVYIYFINIKSKFFLLIIYDIPTIFNQIF